LTLKQQEDTIQQKLDKLINDTEQLLNDTYWSILKEKYIGLLQANHMILKKIKEELDSHD
jgi:hypothetical protein